MMAITLTSQATALAQSTAAPALVTVAPTDPNITYIGRWDRTDPTLYHSYWGGAYLRTQFTGTSVGIKLAAGCDLVVSIDGEAPGCVSAGSGITALNTGPLKIGTHALLVGSAGQNFEVPFQGLVLDAGAATVPAATPPPPIIEFIGDSITTGTGSYNVGTVNWAWMSAEALNCDHTQIAFSGLALTSGYGCLPKKVGLDTLYFLEKNYNHLDDNPQTPWNFSYTPAMVVINLGQNDQCGQEPPATVHSNMISFVGKIRAKFPQAQIVVLRPFSGAFADAIHSAVDSMNASGDTRVHFIDTTGWLVRSDFRDGTHPNGHGNIIIVGHLVPLLRPFLPS